MNSTSNVDFSGNKEGLVLVDERNAISITFYRAKRKQGYLNNLMELLSHSRSRILYSNESADINAPGICAIMDDRMGNVIVRGRYTIDGGTSVTFRHKYSYILRATK
jgi:hypothetical protein